MYYSYVLMSGNNALAAAKRRRVGAQTQVPTLPNNSQLPLETPKVVNPLDALTTHAFQIEQINRVVDKLHQDGGVFHRLESIEKTLEHIMQQTSDKSIKSENGNMKLDISEQDAPTFTEKT